MGISDLAEILLGALAAVIIIAIVWYLLQVIAYWKVFKKAGESGWKSIIPIYNDYVQYKVTWKGWLYWVFVAATVVGGALTNYSGAAYAIGVLLLVVAFVMVIMSNYKLAKAFGHGVGYTIGLIILKPIFTMVLGFGSDAYQGPQ